jgi:hypothetical protein
MGTNPHPDLEPGIKVVKTAVADSKELGIDFIGSQSQIFI